jgi:hypothetical protein
MLIACPDRAESVTDQASACHRCGHPVNSWVHRAKGRIAWLRRGAASAVSSAEISGEDKP